MGAPLDFLAFPPPQLTEHDTDSDSDLSLEDDPSGSFGSTHSSDSEDEAAGAGWDALLRPEQPPAPTGKSHNGGPGGLTGPGGGRTPAQRPRPHPQVTAWWPRRGRTGPGSS